MFCCFILLFTVHTSSACHVYFPNVNVTKHRGCQYCSLQIGVIMRLSGQYFASDPPRVASAIGRVRSGRVRGNEPVDISVPAWSKAGYWTQPIIFKRDMTWCVRSFSVCDFHTCEKCCLLLVLALSCCSHIFAVQDFYTVFCNAELQTTQYCALYLCSQSKLRRHRVRISWSIFTKAQT